MSITATTPTAEFYRSVACRYPDLAAAYYAADAVRMAFQASLLHRPSGTFVDVGSGLTPLALGLKLLGMEATMVDRFDYPIEMEHIGDPDPVMAVLDESGVILKPADIAADLLPLDDGHADTLSCVACIEHFHVSPRPLLSDIRRVLRPGGLFLMGCPNSVNLRKRVAVLRGRTNLPPIGQFWNDGDPVWYGHVREPTLAEMCWMAEASGFEIVERFGRNFLGEQNYGTVAHLLDPFLRFMPALCSDIYVLARKPVEAT